MRAIQVRWCENKKFSDADIKKFILDSSHDIDRMGHDFRDIDLPLDCYIDKFKDDDIFLSEFRNLYEKLQYNSEDKIKEMPIVVAKREVEVPSIMGNLVMRCAIEGRAYYPVDTDTYYTASVRNVPMHGFRNFYLRIADGIEVEDFLRNKHMTGRKIQKENYCFATSYFLKSQPMIHYFSYASWVFSRFMHLNNLVLNEERRNIGGEVVELDPKWREIDEL